MIVPCKIIWENYKLIIKVNFLPMNDNQSLTIIFLLIDISWDFGIIFVHDKFILLSQLQSVSYAMAGK